MAAGLSGLSSGVVPHQGLTNLEIAGFDDITRTIDKFNRSQLDIMALAGVWIVTQDLNDGEVFSRHAVTTGDNEDLNQREEQITRNVDSISYLFARRFAPYIGISNVTPSMIDIIWAETRSAIEFLRSNGFVQRLGSQLIDAEITELRPHALLKDRIVLAIDLELPIPLNNLEIHLIV